ALDIDPRNGGSESLAELVHSHSKIPDTVQTITGSGGQHLWFQMPEWNVRNITLAPGINIRGDGGYIVVPHSLHVSGSHYEFDLFSHPDRVPIAPAPDWLLKLLYERAHSGRSLSDEFTLDKIPRTLPRSAWHILKGTSRRHYETRSEAEQAAITAMVNAGFTLDAIRDAFEQYAHDGTHYRHEIKNRGRVQAEHWLKHSYQNAVAFVQHNTTPEARAAEERAAKRRAWALSTPWEGRSGPTQLKVALAHISIVETSKRVEYHADELTLARQAGCTRKAVHNANKALVQKKFIRVVIPYNPHKPSLATRYELLDLLPMFDVGTNQATAGGPSSPNATIATTHDAFRGRAAMAQIFTLIQQQPRTLPDLIKQSGRNRATVWRVLKQLADINAIRTECSPQHSVTYHALDINLEQIAQQFGTDITGDRYRQKIEQQRAERRKRLA